MRKNGTTDIEDAVGNKGTLEVQINKKEKWPIQKLLGRKQQQVVRIWMRYD
jgi:hypothetical protein